LFKAICTGKLCEVEDRDEIIKAAHQYASKGQINDAIAEYLKILPYSVDGNIRNVIGDLYLKNKSTDEAIKYFREAAAIFNKEESHAKAIALYHKILSINPNQHAVEMELAELNAERGFITQAIEGMSRAAEAYYSKGLPMKALGVYKKALKLCPSNIELKFIIADLHLEVNHTDRAVKLYLTIAMEYEANAESARAEHMYKKVFSLDPDNIESLTHLSRLAEDDQDLELALEYMSKAAAIAPHNSEIMLEYSNLEQKANKDISESSQRVHDGPDHNEPQNIHIPDAVNHYNKTDNTHEPLDLSLESSNTGNLHSGKPISSSSSQLPVTSTGSGYEETGFAVPPDTVDTGIEKNGIWDNSPDEDNSNPSVIDSIEGKTSNVIPGHETAEAEYDQHTEKNDLNMSIKKTDHNKSIKDSQRLKRRVKTNRVHVLLIVIFTCITAISFFITFKFIKNAQTVDVETPEHVISPEPYNHNNGEDIDILHNESTITDLNTADEQSIKKPVSLNSGKYPQEINQDELTLPDRESDTPGIDSDILPDDSIDIALEEEGNNYSNNTEDTIVSTMKPDRDAIHVTEEPQVIIKGLLTVPVKESDSPGIDSEILPDNSIDIAPEQEGNNYSNNTEDTIVSTLKPDREIAQEQEKTHIDTETLNVPETKDEMQQQEEHKEEKTALISFNEFFDNNNNNWDIVETSAASVRLENGKYYIRNGRSSGAYIILNGPYISTDLDFEVESHLDSVDPSEDHTYGLIFGAKNKEDFFVFQIRPGNNYSIKKYFRGVALELAGGKINSRPEAQDLYNVLKITCKDNKLSFFINENFIDEVPDIYFSRRKTGLFIDSNAEIVVDKILLHQQPR